MQQCLILKVHKLLKINIVRQFIKRTSFQWEIRNKQLNPFNVRAWTPTAGSHVSHVHLAAAEQSTDACSLLTVIVSMSASAHLRPPVPAVSRQPGCNAGAAPSSVCSPGPLNWPGCNVGARGPSSLFPPRPRTLRTCKHTGTPHTAEGKKLVCRGKTKAMQRWAELKTHKLNPSSCSMNWDPHVRNSAWRLFYVFSVVSCFLSGQSRCCPIKVCGHGRSYLSMV